VTEQRKRQVQALIARYIAEGRCIDCSQPAAPFRRCERCRRRTSINCQRWRNRQKVAA
jgi:hypothetical protein